MVVRHVRVGPETNSSYTNVLVIGKEKRPFKGRVNVTLPFNYGDRQIFDSPDEITAFFYALALMQGRAVHEEFLKALKELGIEVEGHTAWRGEFLRIRGPQVGLFLAEMCKYAVEHGHIISDYDWRMDDDLLDEDPLSLLRNNPFVVKNGNYWLLFEERDGKVFRKIRLAFHDDSLKPDRPELVDVKITNYCQHNCAFCAEDSSVAGKHGDVSWLRTLPVGTEVTIGGGNPLSHPDLRDIVFELRTAPCFVSVTIRDIDFVNMNAMGIPSPNWGISLTPGMPKDRIENVLIHNGAPEFPFGNLVFHAILGVNKVEDVLFEVNPYNAYAVLFLGFKRKGRGKNFEPKEPVPPFEELKKIVEQHFPIWAVGFDHLALEQLGVPCDQVKEAWPLQYGGLEGEFSIYVDLVEKKVKRNSYQGPEVPLPAARDWWRIGWEKVRP